MNETPHPSSPRWGAMTKLVFAMTAIVVIGALIVRFHTILGPIVMAFLIAYLLQPIASLIEKKTPLSWRMTINLIYLIVIIVLIALATWGGVGLVSQIQSLIHTIQLTISNLPATISEISGKVYHLGPFVLDLTKLDWTSLSQQIISVVQPVLGRVGNLVADLAGSAVTTLTWIAFIIIVSYFFLLESGGLRSRIIQVEIPGHTGDIQKLGHHLSRIWNAFLRGQMIISLSAMLVYTLLLTILGVRFSLGIGILAGFATFVPYVGPATAWIVLCLVTYFQGSNPFGLAPLTYMIVSILSAVLIDQIYNNLVAPRIMAQTLKVHPAFVLIAAIVAANLFGILGVIVAAPLLATLRLIGQYSLRKMFDLDPWPALEEIPAPPPVIPRFRRIKAWWKALQKKKE